MTSPRGFSPAVERLTHKPFDMRRLQRDVVWKREMAAKQQRLANALRGQRMTVAECPACRARKFGEFVRVYDYPFHQCAACGHIFSGNPPTADAVRALYEAEQDEQVKSAQNDVYMLDDLFNVRVEQVARPKGEFIAQRAGPPGRWIDIGAGVGDLVLAAQRLGWDAVGLESDAKQVAFAQARGVPMQTDYLNAENATRLLRGARVVSFINVLEHVLEPREFLKIIAGALGKGAFIAFEVPRHPSLSSFANLSFPQLAGRHIYPPDHLHIFTETSVSALLQPLGLVPLSVWTFGQDAFELLSSVAATVERLQPSFYDEIVGISDDLQKVIDARYLSDTMLVLARKET